MENTEIQKIATDRIGGVFMFHKIKEIVSLNDLKITVVFQGGIKKVYDVTEMFNMFPQMKELEDETLLNSAVLDAGGYGISWNDELDIDAEEIWDNGTEIGRTEIDIAEKVGMEIATIRSEKGITQKELAEITGIDQGNISRIEKGNLNPSLKILDKIAKGLNVQINLRFVQSNINK